MRKLLCGLLFLATVLTLAPDTAWAQAVAMKPLPPRSITGTLTSDTASGSDYGRWIVWKSTANAAKTQTLPSCSGAAAGLGIGVSDGAGTAGTTGNNISIAPPSGSTINGVTTPQSITTNRGTAQFVCDGFSTNWMLITASGGTASSVTMGGDVTGNSAAATVVKLQGLAVSATTPTVNQYLAYNGTNWVPTTPTSGGSGGGVGSITFTCPASSALTGAVTITTGIQVETETAAATVAGTDCQQLMKVTGSGAITLPAASTLPTPFSFSLGNYNATGGSSFSLVAASGAFINGLGAANNTAASVAFAPGQTTGVAKDPDGTDWDITGPAPGSSSGGGGAHTIRTVITATGNFTPNASTVTADVGCIGGGGGAGSGSIVASGTGTSGGGAGGTSMPGRGTFSIAQLIAAETSGHIPVTIGAAGTGGTSPATGTAANGGNGGGGGTTTFGPLLNSYGGGGGAGAQTSANAGGGGGAGFGGAGGNATSATAGTAGSNGGTAGGGGSPLITGGQGGASGALNTGGGNAGYIASGSSGGGGGGGINGGGTAFVGGNAGFIGVTGGVPTQAFGSAANSGAAGQSGVNLSILTGLGMIGGSGGGGGGGSSVAGTPGGAGGTGAPGAGGGAGGSVLTTNTVGPGAGGSGGGGECIVEEHA